MSDQTEAQIALIMLVIWFIWIGVHIWRKDSAVRKTKVDAHKKTCEEVALSRGLTMTYMKRR